MTFSSVFAYHSLAAVVWSPLNVSAVHFDGSARFASVSALNLDRLESNDGRLESSKKREQNKEADDLIHGEVTTQLRGPLFCMLYIYDERESHPRSVGCDSGKETCTSTHVYIFFLICRRRTRRGEKASVVCLSKSNSAYLLIKQRLR